jgi:hypothetical protein
MGTDHGAAAPNPGEQHWGQEQKCKSPTVERDGFRRYDTGGEFIDQTIAGPDGYGQQGKQIQNRAPQNYEQGSTDKPGLDNTGQIISRLM